MPKSRKRQHRYDKKIAKGIEKKSGVGVVNTAISIQGTGKQQEYKPYGKFKDKLQIIGDSLFAAGFVYVPSKDVHKFKHKSCRFCQTTFTKKPSDVSVIKKIVSTIKRMCQTQCVPPIPLDKLPAKLFTIKMSGLVETEKEWTILDVLNEITKTVTLSAQVDREIREDLRRIADQKGITLGDLIEEMKEVYEKSQ